MVVGRIMRESTMLLGVAMALAISGCGDAGQPGPPVPLKSFVLYDVQGLFGGHALWVAEDNTAIVQVVNPAPPDKVGLWEKRYKTKLTAEQRAEVERLVGAYDFLRLKIKDRSAVPDEARSTIVLVTKNGEKANVGKWANDKNPRFDRLYEYLHSICRLNEGRELVSEGAFDQDWQPEGFENPFAK